MHAEDVLESIELFCLSQKRDDNDIVTQQLIAEILYLIKEYWDQEEEDV